ncbi:uncharacterized protein LOC114297828 [Camellia sinensis]|uniref:uncharacterized protein LOC114297828 n=1 Tax=Camellia sinensis TaxID=4442 RepID=UPI001035F829|nr:uncharacterized protein LOC114297828 [Camellia sinensis]
MRQRRWLELLEDYDLTINYHPGKANAMADALSRKTSSNLATLITDQKNILEDLQRLNIEIRWHNHGVQLANLRVQPTLIDRIKDAQGRDPQFQKLKAEMEIGLQMEFCMHKDRTLRFGERLFVPNDLELKREILREAHSSGYTVKVEHQRPAAFKVGFSLERFSKLYIKEIVKLHGIPVTIVSDRDSRFVSIFWRRLHTALGTSLNFSTAFHPQTDGQSERTIQTLEDMLRPCIIDLRGSWDEHLALVSPICWDDVGEKKLLGPEIVQQTVDKINLIREQLCTAQSRQKSYADNRRHDLVFGVGDHVFLKVSPMKRVMRFGVRGKLSPRFVKPFEVLDRIGEVAYRLALPHPLVGVHNVIHVSMLSKYILNPNHVIDHAPLQFKEDLTYEEHPIRIVDKKEQVLRRRVIHYIKLQWSNHSEREATWKLEDEMRQKYPQLFETTSMSNFEDEISFTRGRM